MSRRLALGILVAVILTGFVPIVADAQNTTGLAAERLRILPPCASSGNCGFDDFIQLFANLAKWGFAMLAVVALVYMIWGGGWLLISGGRREYISKGKEVIKGAFLGSLVVLTAIVLVNFIGLAIGNKSGNLLNTSAACRLNADGRYQGGASSLQNGDFDPNTGPGRIVTLQTLLAQKCPESGIAIDGCFGNETAFWLFNFKASNNVSDLPSDYRQTRATTADIALLQNPSSNGCTLDVSIPDPRVPDSSPDIENPSAPAQQAGCCVPNFDTYSCLDVDSEFECPFEVATEPGQSQLYSFQPQACGQITTCRPQCCWRSSDNSCRSINDTAQCLDGIPLNGTCAAQGSLCQ